MPDEANSPPDEELVQRCRDGDRHAFGILVDRYWERVFAWLYRLSGSLHTAEDLAQETFFKAWNGLGNYQTGPGFRAWVYRIARNAWIDYCRKHNQDVSVGMIDEHQMTKGMTPLQEILVQEQEQLLQTAITSLPSDLREALLLRAVESMSFAEIAEIVAANPDTARWRVFKARQILMKQFGMLAKTEESTS